MSEPVATPAPRVVLFRPMPLDRDTRAKKFAATLARGGYDVVVLAPVNTGSDTTEQAMGGVRIIPVPVGTRHRDAANRRASVLRQTQIRLLSREDPESYVTRVVEHKRELRRNRAKSARLRSQVAPTASGVVAGVKLAVVRGQASALKVELRGMRSRWLAQDRLNRTVARSWKSFDHRRRATQMLATTRGVLPEVRDYADAFAPVLDQLEPDVIHAHHPFILQTALRAARRRVAAGHDCAIVYDARENFAGIPEGEQGSPRRHAVLVRQEATAIRHVDRVITVSEPIADELQGRYGLPRTPNVVLNVPVRVASSAAPTVRQVVGVDADTMLLLYSGGVSAARGIETLVDALSELPDAQLAIVVVPHPHPSIPALLARADRAGNADRVHVAGPVSQRDIATFLSGADVAIHPLPGGSPNHDQAMPNKLFEYLHAGLPLVVSDAKMMAAFVRDHEVGETFVSGHPDSLASAVERLRSAPPSKAHLAAVAERYSWQGQEAVVLKVYDELTGWSSRVPGAGDIDLEVTTHESEDE